MSSFNNLQTLGTKVLLVFPQDEEIKNGIVVPSSVLRMDAVVVSCGKDVCDFGTGDRVIADQKKGIRLHENGITYHLMDKSDIEAVLS